MHHISDITSRLQIIISIIACLVPKVAIRGGRGTQLSDSFHFDWQIWRQGKISEKNVFLFLSSFVGNLGLKTYTFKFILSAF